MHSLTAYPNFSHSSSLSSHSRPTLAILNTINCVNQKSQEVVLGFLVISIAFITIVRSSALFHHCFQSLIISAVYTKRGNMLLLLFHQGI